MRESTRWITINGTCLITRLHYPHWAGKFLVKLDRFRCRNRFVGWIIRHTLRAIGVWQEYRATKTVWRTTQYFMTQNE